MHRIIRAPAAFATVLALALLAIGVPPTQAAQRGDPVFEQQMGSRGRDSGQLLFPTAAVPDAAGHLYVSDTGNHRVQKFSASGALLGQWGTAGSGDGQFQFPAGLAVTANRHVYVVDQQNSRIQKFTDQGVYELKWGGPGGGAAQFNGPQGIAVAPDGSVYVADTGNHRIQRFNAAGTYLGEWGAPGSASGQLGTPYGVAVDELGAVYVADSGNNRVQRFSAEGEFLGAWGTRGTQPGQFDFPDGIAIDGSGDVFVSDGRNGRVQKFTGAGAFVTQFGVPGETAGRFMAPLGISVGAAGRLYIADYGNHRIQVFREAAPAGFTAAPPTLATVGRSYSGLVRTEAFPAVESFAVTAGALPPGLVLQAGGALRGTPTASGRFTFTLSARNGVLPAATRSFTITVASPAVFTSRPPARARVGKRYSAQLRASAFPAVTSYTIVAGRLPRGLRLSAAGRISGTPTRAGKFSVTVRANTAARPSTTQRFTITVKRR